ncbi:PREDICTED: probable inactive shikimate kinase like 2, chloroplastic isoform X3 [Theobroma cacao]|uniref:Probable inactive shikimate kinase like 2, chloroplastic isoform X3 n=1 Tax=Theobroma cacao TaxID=3641 RepID=A0AB32W216_THECC|nr:PREDICTED: probable inactive shikimate kinase like 2, chloroplastic isoform X3 [Theobroma cacao]
MAGAIASAGATLCFSSQNPIKTLHFSTKTHSFYFPKPKVSAFRWNSVRPISPLHGFSCNCFSTVSTNTTHYEFSDGSSEVELRLQLGGQDVPSAKDIFVDADGTSLTVKDLDLEWPDIVESWESLSAGSMQLLKGTSIYIVGDSTEINQKVARELAVALGYTPLDTKELLETFTKQTVDSWVLAEGSDSVAEAESAILESLSSHVRAVVATLGGSHGAAGRTDKWRHLYSGFTVWLSQTEAIDEDSAKEEARRHVQDGSLGYSNADVVVKLQGWDADHAKSLAQASLSALKQLILSDKKLPGKKSLYIRLGCRGHRPNIKPPGWDPSTPN